MALFMIFYKGKQGGVGVDNLITYIPNYIYRYNRAIFSYVKSWEWGYVLFCKKVNETDQVTAHPSLSLFVLSQQ